MAGSPKSQALLPWVFRNCDYCPVCQAEREVVYLHLESLLAFVLRVCCSDFSDGPLDAKSGQSFGIALRSVGFHGGFPAVVSSRERFSQFEQLQRSLID